MNILCTICARKGSVGVKNKNLKKINNKPLIQYTIEHAINSKLFNHIVISTDSKKIKSISENLGLDCWFVRPKNLSSNHAPKIPVIKDTLLRAEKYFEKKFDVIVDLDVTSPLRNVEDIKTALNQFSKEKSDTLISVCKSRKNPYFNMIEIINNKVKVIKEKRSRNKITRRQNAPVVYEMNASIYIWKRSALINNKPLFSKSTSVYLMPFERSIDIDNELDFKLVEFLMK